MNAGLSKCVTPILAALCGSVLHAASPELVDTLAKLSLEWVKARSESVRAETEWGTQRELLTSTVKVFEERARELESKRDLLRAKTAGERADLDQMEVENQRLAAELRRLEESLVALHQRLVALRPQLPPKLSQALDFVLVTLADRNLPVGERMAHTITVLDRCVQFNRSISSGEEVVAVPGEPKPKLRQTLYWGLSHGYAYDKSDRKAWFGSPGADGWTWTPCDESAGAIAELIATLGEKAEPKFVAVPAAAGRLVNPTVAR